jgi:predicted transcriptional regulator
MFDFMSLQNRGCKVINKSEITDEIITIGSSPIEIAGYKLERELQNNESDIYLKISQIDFRYESFIGKWGSKNPNINITDKDGDINFKRVEYYFFIDQLIKPRKTLVNEILKTKINSFTVEDILHYRMTKNKNYIYIFSEQITDKITDKIILAKINILETLNSYLLKPTQQFFSAKEVQIRANQLTNIDNYNDPNYNELNLLDNENNEKYIDIHYSILGYNKYKRRKDKEKYFIDNLYPDKVEKIEYIHYKDIPPNYKLSEKEKYIYYLNKIGYEQTEIAYRLNITQPAISKSLNYIENKIEDKYLRRYKERENQKLKNHFKLDIIYEQVIEFIKKHGEYTGAYYKISLKQDDITYDMSFDIDRRKKIIWIIDIVGLKPTTNKIQLAKYQNGITGCPNNIIQLHCTQCDNIFYDRERNFTSERCYCEICRKKFVVKVEDYEDVFNIFKENVKKFVLTSRFICVKIIN